MDVTTILNINRPSCLPVISAFPRTTTRPAKREVCVRDVFLIERDATGRKIRPTAELQEVVGGRFGIFDECTAASHTSFRLLRRDVDAMPTACRAFRSKEDLALRTAKRSALVWCCRGGWRRSPCRYRASFHPRGATFCLGVAVRGAAPSPSMELWTNTPAASAKLCVFGTVKSYTSSYVLKNLIFFTL